MCAYLVNLKCYCFTLQFGSTALILAAAEGHLAVVALLIEQDAQIDEQNLVR